MVESSEPCGRLIRPRIVSTRKACDQDHLPQMPLAGFARRTLWRQDNANRQETRNQVNRANARTETTHGFGLGEDGTSVQYRVESQAGRAREGVEPGLSREGTLCQTYRSLVASARPSRLCLPGAHDPLRLDHLALRQGGRERVADRCPAALAVRLRRFVSDSVSLRPWCASALVP